MKEIMQTSFAGDLNTSAYYERGKAKMSSIDEIWEDTLLISPPDLVPMWATWRTQEPVAVNKIAFFRVGELQGIEACMLTRTADQEAPKWRVASN